MAISNGTSFPEHCLNDYSIGPVVQGCHGNFDFTLLFEQICFSVVPSSLLLIFFPIRILSLRRKSLKTRKTALLTLKQVAIAVLASMQLAQLVLFAVNVNVFHQIIPSLESIAFVTSVALVVLSSYEHTRTIRPSSVITVFLFISILLDMSRVRSLWIRNLNAEISRLSLAILICKTAVLILEIREKRRSLKPAFISSPPEATASLPNRTFFWWVNPLLIRGTRAILSVGDLWKTDSALRSERLYDQFQQRYRRYVQDDKKKKSPIQHYALLLVTFRSIILPMLYPIIPRLLLAGFLYCQPLLINRVIDTIQKPPGENGNQSRLGLVGAAALIYTGAAITNSLYSHFVYRSITMVRGILVSAIYVKSLSVSLVAGNGGESITLANTDVERICFGLQNMHQIWASIIELGFAIYLLRQYLGIAWIVPIVLTIVCTIWSMSISSKVSKYQAAWNQAVQRRVSAMTSILGSIKNIKISSMSDAMSREIHSLRIKEIGLSKRSRWMNVLTNLISNIPAVLSPIVSFTVVAFTSGPGTIDISTVFAALAIIGLVCETVSTLLASIPSFVSTFGCFRRIQVYLHLPEHGGLHKALLLPPQVLSDPEADSESAPGNTHEIELKSLDKSRVDARNQNQPAVELARAEFWGSGSLQPVLRDVNLNVRKGSFVIITGPVGSGKSLLLKAMLREIEPTSGFIHVRCASVAYCAGNLWLPNTSIRSAILMDSPFDQEWYYTTIKACALETDFLRLPEGDNTMISGGGSNLSGGQKQRISLCRALYARKELLLLDDVLSGLDGSTRQWVWRHVFGEGGLCRKNSQTVLLATHSVEYARDADMVLVIGNGSLSQREPSSLAQVQMKKRQLPTSTEAATEPDAAEISASDGGGRPVQNPVKLGDPAEVARKTGDTALYAYFFRRIGWAHGIVFIFLASSYVFLEKFPQTWLRWWAEVNLQGDRVLYTAVYFTLGILCLCFLVAGIAQFFISIVPKFVLSFHSSLLKTVMSAPLSFFTGTASGSILNRFSQDIQLIDMSLSSATFMTAFHILMCVSEVVLISMGARYIAAIIPLGFAFAYCIQKFYLYTSRQLRYLELETKAPLYTLFIDTVQMLETIRAFGWQNHLHDQFFELLDMSQRPFYLLFCIQRWLNVVLDLFVAAVAVILIAFSVHVRSSGTAGAVGVALVNVLSFNQNIATLVVTWTALETSLGAISRLRAFEKSTPSEPSGEADGVSDLTLSPEWPQRGAIKFANVSAGYSPDSPPVLHDVNLFIEPGRHVCICGRTGSGKSTFLSLLLALMNPITGTIHIDEISLSTPSPALLRSRIIAVSQDPIQPISTPRHHLDPERNHDTTIILSVLAEFNLANLFDNLDTDITRSTLSAGQAQLLSLVRAVLRRRNRGAKVGGVLLLDEATSALDIDTERLAMRVLRKEFRGWTVLSVVHRQYLVAEFDAVIRVDERGVRLEELR